MLVLHCLNQKKNILITGASGFLGSQLAINMAKEGHTVYALDIRAPSDNFQKAIKELPNIIPIKADISEFGEHLIRDEKDYEHHLNYIHNNPVKHNYVEKASA